MAQFTKVNGDLLPVLRLDATSYTNAGANAVTSAATVQPQGPKLDFFSVTANSSLAVSGAGNAAGYVNNILHVFLIIIPWRGISHTAQ